MLLDQWDLNQYGYRYRHEPLRTMFRIDSDKNDGLYGNEKDVEEDNL